MEYICGCTGQYNRLTSQVGGNKTQGEDVRKEIKDVQTEKFDFFFFFINLIPSTATTGYLDNFSQSISQSSLAHFMSQISQKFLTTKMNHNQA